MTSLTKKMLVTTLPFNYGNNIYILVIYFDTV